MWGVKRGGDFRVLSPFQSPRFPKSYRQVNSSLWMHLWHYRAPFSFVGIFWRYAQSWSAIPPFLLCHPPVFTDFSYWRGSLSSLCQLTSFSFIKVKEMTVVTCRSSFLAASFSPLDMLIGWHALAFSPYAIRCYSKLLLVCNCKENSLPYFTLNYQRAILSCRSAAFVLLRTKLATTG